MLERRSLPAQLILSFIGMVILTALATGAPAIWLFRQQLDQQAWAQVEQGHRAAQSLYALRQAQIASLAALASQRPTLHALLQGGNRPALEEYLTTLQRGANADFVAVCNPNGLLAARTEASITEEICDEGETEGYHAIPFGDTRRVWMTAAHPIAVQGENRGEVIVGVLLDQAFVDQMRAQTGLEHTLFVEGEPVATSFEAGLSNLNAISQQPASPGLTGEAICSTFELGCQPYYSARIELIDSGLEVAVALDVSDIAATQKRLLWIWVGSMVAVIAVGSTLGVFLARRISRPLVRLSGIASNLSKGDLDTPVTVQAEVREVVLVAQALERARLDLRRTFNDLRQEKAWVDHLLESIVEGIVTLDRDLRITSFSHGAEQITGWSRRQVLNRPCDEVFKIAEGVGAFSSCIPAPGQQTKLLLELAGQRTATLSLTGARLAPSEASDAQVVFVFRDVSEEESTHRLLGQFLANISHEFRTPLSALAASIEILLDQASNISPAELEELLKSIHLGVLNLQTLVDNLLESSSIEAGHFRVFPRPYDLCETIQEAAQTIQPLLDKYGQSLVLDLPAEIPLVRVDPRRTVQVLINLLSNASKYGPSDAEITLRAMVLNDHVQVEVADRGPGIPPQHREDVFRRFMYPVASSSTLKVGAGLGLSVVKAVVEAQGGRVGVKDRPGGGAAFWLTVPVAEET